MTGRLLGLDYGTRTIGVAVSDPLGITAQHVDGIRRVGTGPDIAAIGEIAARCGVSGVIVGLPLLPDGNEGDQARKARAFGDRIRETLGLPVEMWDERHTTVQAERHLIESGVRRDKRKAIRDSLSAVLILQSALDFRNRA